MQVGVREQVISKRLENEFATLQVIGDAVGVSRERVRQILHSAQLETVHTPSSPHRFCQVCNKRLNANQKRYCSVKCQQTVTWTEFICDQCQQPFKKRNAELLYQRTHLGYKHTFCSRKCLGAYFGKHYGFSVTRKANYDPEFIKTLYLSDYKLKDIASMVNISISAVNKALDKFHEQGLKYRNRRPR